MTWKDARVENLDPPNFVRIAGVSKTDIRKLENLWAWCYNRNRIAVIHYGLGWLQIMKVDRDVIKEPSIRKFLDDHNNWGVCAIGEQIDWTRYEDPQYSVIYQPTRFGEEPPSVRIKRLPDA